MMIPATRLFSRALIISAAIDCSHSIASANVVFDLEPNNTMITAQPVALDFNSLFTVVNGTILPGDVDFFQLNLPQTLSIGAFLQPVPPDVDLPPHNLALFNSQGSQVNFGFLPGGIYTLGLTGINDVNFMGDHQQNFNYQIVIAYTPSAPTLAMFAVAMIAGPRRRRLA